VFLQALNWLEEQEQYQPEYVVQLRPTSPIRPVDLVDRALTILIENPAADSVRGVVPSGQNPFKMWKISGNGQLHPLLKNDFEEPYNMPRQELPQTYWQTGHIDVIRSRTILEKHSMSGQVILPIMIDPAYTVDIDTLLDSERAQRFLSGTDLEFIQPGKTKRMLPEEIELVVFDFDGVFTDNRVWLNREGEEFVAADRGDGWGIARMLERGVQGVVLSTETDSVVKARCEKLGLPVVQGVQNKLPALQKILDERGISADRAIYLGNDINDVPCFSAVACAVVVNDAHPEAKRAADLVLSRPGGKGAIRELTDQILLMLEE
jgi:N-acylneuraminate cytidylyltransferase